MLDLRVLLGKVKEEHLISAKDHIVGHRIHGEEKSSEIGILNSDCLQKGEVWFSVFDTEDF